MPKAKPIRIVTVGFYMPEAFLSQTQCHQSTNRSSIVKVSLAVSVVQVCLAVNIVNSLGIPGTSFNILV